MKSKEIGFFGIAMTFVGTLIGAGFASGQEILQFFAGFGANGIMGSCVVAALFSILGVVIMLTARNLNTSAYEAVVSPNNKIINVSVNVIITFFSFGVITVMLAGTGSLLSTIFGWNPFVGNLLMAAVMCVVTLFGSEGMINSFSIVVPVMVVIAVVSGIMGIASGNETVSEIGFHPEFTAVNNWIVSALLFVSYNTICAIAVLAPLGYEAKNRKSVCMGAIVGGVILGVIAVLLCGAILTNFSVASTDDMPMYIIAKNINGGMGWAYGFVLLAAIFTTAAGLMYGITVRLSQYKLSFTKNKGLMVIVLSAVALVCSKVGFTTLIGILYPITGYLGFVIIASLVYNFIKSFKGKKRDVCKDK